MAAEAAIDVSLDNLTTAVTKLGSDLQVGMNDLLSAISAGQNLQPRIDRINSITNSLMTFDATVAKDDPGGAATTLVVTTPSTTASTGVPITVTVQANDANGHVATTYAGTLAINTSDPAAVITSATALALGVATYSVTFNTVGPQTITAGDGTLSATSTAITVQ